MTSAISEIIEGDCLDILRCLPDATVDAVVTDPPAGIGFMGKEWDGNKGGRDAWVAWLSSVMAECLRVLKPGGHALVWALPRTSHWTATAVEDAGFEIRDVVTHLFGSGYPKSRNVSKAIDKEAGAERVVIGQHTQGFRAEGSGIDGWQRPAHAVHGQITAPATDAAKQWQGWGTALKPAAEMWVLARKPLTGTVAANVQAYGTGALNIDGCRIATSEDRSRPPRTPNTIYGGGKGTNLSASLSDPQGRWPANVTLDECAAEALDAQSGVSKRRASGYDFADSGNDNPTRIAHNIKSGIHYADSGGASRFFKVFHSEGEDWKQETVKDAGSPFRHPSGVAGIAPDPVRANHSSGQNSPNPSMIGTRSASSEKNGSDTQPTPSTESVFLPAPLPQNTEARVNLAKNAETQSQTGTTQIMTNHSTSYGCADDATYGNTSGSAEHGERDLGSAGRFIYVAKPSTRERNAGLEGMPERYAPKGNNVGRDMSNPKNHLGGMQSAKGSNHHPTVKPIALMRYLCRLITPPDGVILDPFTGSGTTGCAAVLEGFNFVGIEKDSEYAAIARTRIAHWAAIEAKEAAEKQPMLPGIAA